MDTEKTRYNDSELEDFKIIILEKLEEAKDDLNILNNKLSHKSDHGTDDTAKSFNVMEYGAESMNKEMVAYEAARIEKFIISLKHALNRIENKTYGICRVTNKLIPKERLLLVPHATLSIEAKNLSGK